MFNGYLKSAIFFGGLFFALSANAQVDNTVFEDYSLNKPNISILQFAKNNEYAENSNPGKTFLGQQWSILPLNSTLRSNLFSKDLTVAYSLGLFVQFDYGDKKFPSKILPLSSITFSKINWKLRAGNLLSNTQHQLIEPLINYENTFTHPVEYGLQFFGNYKYIRFENWVDWRQLAIESVSRQEVISFGNRGRIPLIRTKFIQAGLPFAALLFHQGGENLVKPMPVTTNFNGSISMDLGLTDSTLILNATMLKSQDISQNTTHAFKNGTAFIFTLSSFVKSHRFYASYYKASEYFSPLAPNLFNSEKIGDPYAVSRNREFIMLRYQYLKYFGNHLIFDARIEPIFHLNKSLFAFSTGLYLKYVLYN